MTCFFLLSRLFALAMIGSSRIDKSCTGSPCRLLAIGDIGSQTFRLVLVGLYDDRAEVLKSLRKNVRLAEGLSSTGVLSSNAIERGIAALKSFVDTIRQFNVSRVCVVATAALRKAKNAELFISLARDIGINIDVITGEEEASISLHAITSTNLNHKDKFLMLDVGGGSTEIIVANNSIAGQEKVSFCRSLDIGAVSLTDRFISSDPPGIEELNVLSTYVTEALSSLSIESDVEEVIGVGGTATTLAAIYHKMLVYSPQIVRGTYLTQEWLSERISYLSGLSNKDRCLVPGLEPKRADIIIAGTIIIYRMLKTFRKSGFIVSDGGLLLGLTLKIIKEEIKDVEPAYTRGIYI